MLNNILIVAAGWHDEVAGGGNKLPTDFARYLTDKGKEVQYLCASPFVKGWDAQNKNGVRVWRYEQPRFKSPSIRNLFSHLFRSWLLSRKIARQGKIEVVLGHSPLQYLGAILGLKGAVKRCYGVHSPFVEELKANQEDARTFKQMLSFEIAEKIEKAIYRKSNIIHSDSFYTLSVLKEQYPRVLKNKGRVLQGWVDTEKFIPSRIGASRERLTLGKPWDPNIPAFFTLRRLVPRMGLDILIEAVHLLRGFPFSFKVMIGGEGPEEARLKERVVRYGLNQRVFLLGKIPEEKLISSFRAADCFVLPTRTLECFGLIILESYACGIPVIGMPVGSIPEVMGEKFSNWLASENTAEALAQKMRDFLVGNLEANSMELSQRALEFSFSHLAPFHEEVLLHHVA